MHTPESVNVSPEMFYGKRRFEKTELEERRKGKRHHFGTTLPAKWPRRLDPSAVWKIFEKQQDALEYLRLKNNGLMAFAFEEKVNRRMFLVTNPLLFWYFYSKRHEMDRSIYEIILENSACKLYFDLEFAKGLNPGHDGSRMTDTFIKVVIFSLKKKWNIDIDRSSVMELDSSTEVKFSHHLIFQLSKAVFQNNIQVGYFVRDICNSLKMHIATFSDQHDKCTLSSLYNIEISHLCELMVKDNKGKAKLFCDEAVYTKNRQFRIYLSTKLNKNRPLVVSKENMYRPAVKVVEDYERQFFLDSLITYITDESLKILSYGQVQVKEKISPTSSFVDNTIMSGTLNTSPYPDLDKFISNLVLPGHIWRSAYFSCASTIVYDIVGYRYCGNIGRHHRRNNIKFVVNLEKLVYYQKCHDPDCVSYRSPECKLPFELLFQLEDESFLSLDDVKHFDSTSGYFGVCESDLLEAMEAVICMEQTCAKESNEVPDYGISDDEVLSASICVLNDG